jgi:hypothetical protein
MKHSGVTSLPCGIITLYGRVAQKRKEVQNTAHEGTTQYLKRNAFTVSKSNCESEISFLSQYLYRKQEESTKSNPISKVIERGVKASAISFADPLYASESTQISAAASIDSSRTVQEEISAKRPRLHSRSKKSIQARDKSITYNSKSRR